MHQLAARRTRFAAGFTLIELIVTVAIIAILASIGYPAYTDYIRRGELPEAFAALSDYRVKMEQYFQDNKSYGTTNGGACANNPSNTPTWATFVPKNQKFFTYACTTTVTSYTITATGSSGKAIGHVYTINDANQPTTTEFKGVPVTKNCWLIKGNEC